MKAIKGWATTICALFFSLSLHAQNSPISLSDTCALRTMLDGMFANLEKGRITSGLLRDFAVEQENLTPYSGTVLVDSNQVNMMKLGFLLPTLQSARVNAGIGRFSAADIISGMKTERDSLHTIPVGIIACRYHYIRADAVSGNRIQFNQTTHQVTDKYDNQGAWVNPYDSAMVFAFSPYANMGQFSAPTFRFRSEYIVQNLPVVRMEFDAGDGRGYRDVVLPGTLTADYPDYGTYDLKLRVTLSDNSQLIGHSVFCYTEETLEPTPMGVGNGGPDADTTITVITAYGTVAGKVSTFYATSNSTQKLVKPLLVAEGFDPKQLNSCIGGHLDGFTRSDIFLDSLSTQFKQEYDLVYIDWQNSEADIRANAELMIEIIKYVNRHKPQFGYSTVVLGQSMGGLIARYALCKMEQEHIPHNVSTYVSYDSPHLGANVPLGAQYALAYYLSEIDPTQLGTIIRDKIAGFLSTGNASSVLQELSNLLYNSQSVKQMVIDYLGGNTVHDQWQAELSQMGFPQGDAGQGMMKICVSNGAVNNYVTGGPLASFSGEFTDGLLLNIIWTLFEVLGNPDASFWDILISLFSTNRTLYGEVTVNPFDGAAAHSDLFRVSLDLEKRFLWWTTARVNLYLYANPAPLNRIPMDASYGSVYAVPSSWFGQGGDNGWIGGLGLLLPGVGYTYSIVDKIMFIPTVSSLCVDYPSPLPLYYYQFNYTTNSANAAHTPFDSVIMANEVSPGAIGHIDMDAAISEAIRNQLVIYQNGFVPEPSISGTAAPVTGSQYSIDGDTPVLVTWSSADTSIVTLSPAGVATVHQNGITTIHAEVVYPLNTYYVEKKVMVGFPVFSLSGQQDQIFGQQEVNLSSSWSNYMANQADLEVTYHWGRRRVRHHTDPEFLTDTITWQTSIYPYYSFYGGDYASTVFFYATNDNYTTTTISMYCSKINPRYPMVVPEGGYVDPSGNLIIGDEDSGGVIAVKAGGDDEPVVSICAGDIQVTFNHTPNTVEILERLLEYETFVQRIKSMKPWGEEEYLIIPLTIHYIEPDETVMEPLVLVYKDYE